MTEAEQRSMLWWATALSRDLGEKQLPPDGDWTTWAVIAGRGFGKTRLGAELTCHVARFPELCAGRIALVGQTIDDVRKTMIEGESGVLACAERAGERVGYTKSPRPVLTWGNGVRAFGYSADRGRQLRGPQHGFAWGDEYAEWEDPEADSNLEFGLRLGPRPLRVLTMTPKPRPEVIELVDDTSGDVVVTTGSMRENAANLPADKVAKWERRYKGTNIGDQELEGKVLRGRGGRLWTMKEINDHRERRAPDLARIVVGVDPAVSDDPDSDETGIIVAGIDYRDPPHFYVLADVTCERTAGPLEWAAIAVAAYHRWRADRAIGETNQGGKMVEVTLRAIDRNISYTGRNARIGKRARAEPLAALYEQGRGHHVGQFPELEQQMVTWVPTQAKSPDRLDALVLAAHDLVLEDEDVGSPLAYTGRNVA